MEQITDRRGKNPDCLAGVDQGSLVFETEQVSEILGRYLVNFFPGFNFHLRRCQ